MRGMQGFHTCRLPDGEGLAGPPAVSTSARAEGPAQAAKRQRCAQVAARSSSSVTPLPACSLTHRQLPVTCLSSAARMVRFFCSCVTKRAWDKALLAFLLDREVRADRHAPGVQHMRIHAAPVARAAVRGVPNLCCMRALLE